MRLPPSKASSRSRVAANTGLRDGTQGLAAQSLRVLLSNFGVPERWFHRQAHSQAGPYDLTSRFYSGKKPLQSLAGRVWRGCPGPKTCGPEIESVLAHADRLLFLSFSPSLFLFLSLSGPTFSLLFSFSGVPLLFLRRSAFCRFRAPPDWRRKLLRGNSKPSERFLYTIPFLNSSSGYRVPRQMIPSFQSV